MSYISEVTPSCAGAHSAYSTVDTQGLAERFGLYMWMYGDQCWRPKYNQKYCYDVQQTCAVFAFEIVVLKIKIKRCIIDKLHLSTLL